MNMNQVPVIIHKHIDKALDELRRLTKHDYLQMTNADICNKAIEIALAEQATQNQYITADEARKLVKNGGQAEWLNYDCWTPCTPYISFSTLFKYRVIKQSELPKQSQDKFITADEARALGAGNAEWLSIKGMWHVCDALCSYRTVSLNDETFEIKYRAIRKEVPAEPTCTRSHPHELMSKECEALTVLAKANNEARCAEIRAAESEFSGLKKVSTEKLAPAWQKLLHDNLWWELYESDKPSEPHAETVPTCQVRNDDTGELKTMTRGAAKKLQAETKDTCWWFLDGREFKGDPEFDSEGIYTYKLKANLVKLDSILMTCKAAIAIWESKKDTCDLFAKSQWTEFELTAPPFIKNEDTGEEYVVNIEYQLRPKAKKSVRLDPAIREGVIELLQELGVS